MSNEKISRNALCPCGSGKKYKKCCGANAVAAEHLVEARRDPHWTPEGVIASKDDTKGSWLTGNPKWTLKVEFADDISEEKVSKRVLECLLKPYYERFCEEVFTRGEKGDDFPVVILQNSQSHDEKTFGQSPGIVMARYCEIWNVYKKKLDEFFANFWDSDFECEVRYDNSCGGPILTITDDKGDMEVFYLSFIDRFRRH